MRESHTKKMRRLRAAKPAARAAGPPSTSKALAITNKLIDHCDSDSQPGDTDEVRVRKTGSLLEQGLLIAAERNSDDISVMMNQPIVPPSD